MPLKWKLNDAVGLKILNKIFFLSIINCLEAVQMIEPENARSEISKPFFPRFFAMIFNYTTIYIFVALVNLIFHHKIAKPFGLK
jgi:hypothetical protein